MYHYFYKWKSPHVSNDLHQLQIAKRSGRHLLHFIVLCSSHSQENWNDGRVVWLGAREHRRPVGSFWLHLDSSRRILYEKMQKQTNRSQTNPTFKETSILCCTHSNTVYVSPWNSKLSHPPSPSSAELFFFPVGEIYLQGESARRIFKNVKLGAKWTTISKWSSILYKNQFSLSRLQ